MGHELAQCGGKLARWQSPRSLLFASLVSCQDANKAWHDLAHEGVQVVLPGGRLLKKRFEENKGDSGSWVVTSEKKRLTMPVVLEMTIIWDCQIKDKSSFFRPLTCFCRIPSLIIFFSSAKNIFFLSKYSLPFPSVKFFLSKIYPYPNIILLFLLC